MTIVLRTRNDLPSPEAYDFWFALGETPGSLAPAGERPDIAAELETAFASCAQEWLDLGRALSREPSAKFAHMPACAANISDFGLMLAWTSMIERWAAEDATTLVVCDDPWLFRQLARLSRVSTGRVPSLFRAEARLVVRGIAARLWRAQLFARWSVQLRSAFTGRDTGDSWILVYGHPRSNIEGTDGYFGDLMARFPRLRRILHADCPAALARRLAGDGRTASVHSWGSPWLALRLVHTHWRPRFTDVPERIRWLVRRSWMQEASTAQAMSIRWHTICATRWLDAVRPSAVAWPWENHGWERAFVREARKRGVKTIGYQHTVVGAFMLNEMPASNPDGLDSVPDTIVCNGSATRDRLLAWGYPADRLDVGGALRFPADRGPAYDPAAPIFLALPFDGRVAGEMVSAARNAGMRGHRFLVKDHPMTPFAFEDGDGLTRTTVPLSEQQSVSAVVYAATAVGLEAVLCGIPTLRFRPKSCLAIDVMPSGLEVPVTDSASLARMLDDVAPPPNARREDSFAPVDIDFWRSKLAAAMEPGA